eukprot:6194594-Pleurochrysis_carterae.AAC.1
MRNGVNLCRREYLNFKGYRARIPQTWFIPGVQVRGILQEISRSSELEGIMSIPKTLSMIP